MNRRGLRLNWVAGLGIALTVAALTVSAARAQEAATQTTLAVETQDHAGNTQATVHVAVTGVDGRPATGSVAIEDAGKQLASIALNSAGQANSVVGLTPGAHTLTAVYGGSQAYLTSTSQAAAVQAQTAGAPDFAVAVSAMSPSNTLTAGASGTATVTITPVNNASLTAPMFVTLSCSGLPDQAACTFTPASVQILSTTPTSCPTGSAASVCPPTSSLVLQTQAASGRTAMVQHDRGAMPIAWAILLPGMFGLGGLAWGARRRRWLSRLSLVALVGLVTVLGTTACNPRYYYFNHGPTNPLPTPAGSYTVTVTAQSANGVTAITHSTTLALTVK